MFPDNFAKREILSMKVRCPNRKMGCNTCVELKHVEVCWYTCFVTLPINVWNRLVGCSINANQYLYFYLRIPINVIISTVITIIILTNVKKKSPQKKKKKNDKIAHEQFFFHSFMVIVEEMAGNLHAPMLNYFSYLKIFLCFSI